MGFAAGGRAESLVLHGLLCAVVPGLREPSGPLVADIG
jgi:hypothetical protein